VLELRLVAEALAGAESEQPDRISAAAALFLSDLAELTIGLLIATGADVADIVDFLKIS
jgi:hypothetical protein